MAYLVFGLCFLINLCSYILVCDLNLLRRKCDIIGFPKPLPDNDTPLVVTTTPTITHEDHVDSHLNENIDDGRHVEEPPTSKQKQDHVNLTPGAITKIMTENFDLKPVLQLSYIKQDSRLMCSINGKQWYGVALSDGSYSEVGFIADEMIRSKQLQKGSVVQLTKFQLVKGRNNMGEMRRYVVQKGFGGPCVKINFKKSFVKTRGLPRGCLCKFIY